MDDSGPAVLAPSKKAAKRAARRAEKVARRAAHQQKERAAQAAAASAASDGIMEITLTAKDESGAGPAVLCAFIIVRVPRCSACIHFVLFFVCKIRGIPFA